MYKIRLATGDDAKEIKEVYSPFVSLTAISSESVVPREYEIKRRINTITNTHPWLVCEIDGKIAGYAYANKLSRGTAYTWTCELSVYVREDYQRCNIASALYYALIEILTLQGFYSAIARVTLPNDKSISFHRAFGFNHSGILHRSIYKLGEWHDVAYFEKMLPQDFPQPTEIIPIKEFNASKLSEIFSKAEKIVRIR